VRLRSWTCLGFASQSQERVLGLCEQWLVTILLLVPVLHGIHRGWHPIWALIDRKSRLVRSHLRLGPDFVNLWILVDLEQIDQR
jgi:hypothetical protein